MGTVAEVESGRAAGLRLGPLGWGFSGRTSVGHDRVGSAGELTLNVVTLGHLHT